MPIRSGPSLPMPRVAASRFLPWIVAMMVFLAALALATVMLLGTALDRWQTNRTGTLTVQLPPGPESANTHTEAQRIVELLTANPRAATAAPLPRDRPAERRAPWVGEAPAVARWPLHRPTDIISVERSVGKA